MEFIEEIKKLENTYQHSEEFIITEGTSPIIITNIPKKDSNELSEQYTRAIARFVAANTNSTYLVKTKDRIAYSEEELKNKLTSLIEKNKLTLLINLSNTTEENDIVYEFPNITESNYSILKELEDAFHEAGITNDKQIESKLDFKELNIDVINIGINEKCRNIDNPDKLNMICIALINYIKMYTNYTD